MSSKTVATLVLTAALAGCGATTTTTPTPPQAGKYKTAKAAIVRAEQWKLHSIGVRDGKALCAGGTARFRRHLIRKARRADCPASAGRLMDSLGAKDTAALGGRIAEATVDGKITVRGTRALLTTPAGEHARFRLVHGTWLWDLDRR